MPGLARLGTAKPHPYAGQNAAAFKKILETLGQDETLRRKEMMMGDIRGALKRGTTLEEIAGIVQTHQEPTYSTEFLPGLLQRIASPFAAQPGTGITDMLLKGTMESAFRTISPSQQIAGFRLENINALKAKIGAGRGTAEDEVELKRLIGPTPPVDIKIGGQPWRAGFVGQPGMEAEAEVEHKARIRLSTSEVNSARQSVKSIIQDMPTKGWTKLWGAGTFDYNRDSLIEGYKHYQIETQYSGKTATNRKVLDDLWDNQIKVYNKTGHKKVRGKNEFDWDPEDPQVIKLRKATQKDVKLNIEPPPLRDKIPIWMQLPEKIRKGLWEMYERGEGVHFDYIKEGDRITTMTVTNPTTGKRIISHNGGTTWRELP